jgi:hypothetical protein
MPSPFVSETATKIFPHTQAAIDYFREKGYIKPVIGSAREDDELFPS